MKNRFIIQIISFITFISVIYFRIYSNIAESKPFFWDSFVYYCGPLVYSLGGEPYGLLTSCSETLLNFKFVYLPIYLSIFKFYLVSPQTFLILWIIICSIATLISAYFLKKIYGYKNYLLVLFLTLFSFSGIPLYGYLSGNISTILYFFTIFGIYLCSLNNPSLIRYGLLIITLPSLFKLHMILFLIVPYSFLGTRYTRDILALTIVPFLFVSINNLLYPELFSHFKNNISVLPYTGDMGVGSMKFINFINSNLFNLSTPYHSGVHDWQVGFAALSTGDFFVDFVIYLLLLFLLIHNQYKIKRTRLSDNNGESMKIKLSIAILATYILIPRLKQYDLFICAIPMFYLINSKFFIESIGKNSNLLVWVFNILLILFFNIQGDNFFIFPILIILYILISINCLQDKKIKA